MKKLFSLLVIGASLLCGCSNTTPTKSGDTGTTCVCQCCEQEETEKYYYTFVYCYSYYEELRCIECGRLKDLYLIDGYEVISMETVYFDTNHNHIHFFVSIVSDRKLN